MQIAKNIETKLKENINFNYFELINNSHLHSSHYQGENKKESHFCLIVASNDFTNLSLVAIHRKINKVLEQEFANGLHALEIKIKK